jgi:hypothetical protein
VETLTAQAVASVLVIGSYFAARVHRRLTGELSRGT